MTTKKAVILVPMVGGVVQGGAFVLFVGTAADAIAFMTAGQGVGPAEEPAPLPSGNGQDVQVVGLTQEVAPGTWVTKDSDLFSPEA